MISALMRQSDHEEKAVTCLETTLFQLLVMYIHQRLMGVRTADLCGHWKDELVQLEQGLNDRRRKGRRLNQGPLLIKHKYKILRII